MTEWLSKAIIRHVLKRSKKQKNSTLKNKQYPLEKIKPSGQRTVQKINRKSKDKPEGLNEKKRLNKN